MSFYSVVPFVKEFYPQYYSIETYMANQCVRIHKVKEEWGIFSNFAATPITVNGVTFKNVEQLYQVMKFKDAETIRLVYNANNPKMTAKKWEKTHRREDWGRIFLDAIKFCIQKKFEQSEEFKIALEKSREFYIVEDQTTFPKKNPDAWGVKLRNNQFVGPNLQGRFLMELRDKGKLEYNLPKDIWECIGVLKEQMKKI